MFEKLKDPKVIAALIAVILAVLMAIAAPVKEVATAVCKQINDSAVPVGEEPKPAQPAQPLAPTVQP